MLLSRAVAQLGARQGHCHLVPKRILAKRLRKEEQILLELTELWLDKNDSPG